MWNFEEIRKLQPERVEALENSLDKEELAEAIARKLKDSDSRGYARFALEQAERNSDEVRVVVQFQIGEMLFDQFFNAKTGYRAQYRKDHLNGLEYNELVINKIRNTLVQANRPTRYGRLLNSEFNDLGPTQIASSQILESFDPFLSKIWFCSRLVCLDGTVDTLATGVVGPKIQLSHDLFWAAPSRTDAESWLDAKGAFISKSGPWQPKDPIQRARRLQSTGEA